MPDRDAKSGGVLQVDTQRVFEPDPNEAPDEDIREAVWELGRAGNGLSSRFPNLMWKCARSSDGRRRSRSKKRGTTRAAASAGISRAIPRPSFG